MKKFGTFEPQVLTSKLRSKHPIATFKKTAKEEEDLFSGLHQLYQIEKDGQVKTYDDRVTLHEFRLFMDSQTDTHTVEALLAFVRNYRAAKLQQGT